MIIKSVRIRGTGRAAGDVLSHLLHGEENEAARILQGTEQDVRDMVADARRRSRLYAFRHFAIAPETETSSASLLAVLDDLSLEFKFDARSAFVVEHSKARSTGVVTNHLHALVPEVDPDGRVLSSSNSFARQEKIARLAEVRLGHRILRGAHHRAVLAALRAPNRTAR